MSTTENRKKVAERVYELVSLVPKGKVTTYGDIAGALDISPRYVGFILHNNPYEGKVPCHRVVSSQGLVAANFAFGGKDSQQKMLEAEGIIFTKGKLNLSLYRYAY